jgi:hypothetical protein
MKNASRLTVMGLILTTGVALLSPGIANADGLQQSKNTWRNIATSAAVLTGIGIANHNGTETAIGAIGTLVGLSNYEQAREQQAVEQNDGFVPAICNAQPGYVEPQYNVGIQLNTGDRFTDRNGNDRNDQRFDNRQDQDRGRHPDNQRPDFQNR